MTVKKLFAIKSLSTARGASADDAATAARATLSSSLLKRGTLGARMRAAGWGVVSRDAAPAETPATALDAMALDPMALVTGRRCELEAALKYLSQTLVDEDLALAVGQIGLIAKARERRITSLFVDETISAASAP